MGRRRFVICLLVGLVVALAGTARSGTAWTDLPGHMDGVIAFALGGSLVAVDPSNPGAAGEITSCAPGCSIADPAWSPSGRSVAFIEGAFAVNHPSRMSLYVSSANGEDLKRLAPCGDCGWTGSRLAWSPNDKWIVFSHDDFRTGRQPLWVVAAAGGKPHPLTHCHTRCADLQPTWSPNGQLLLFERITKSDWSTPTLFAIRPNGTGLREIVAGEDPEWSPDGREIAFEDSHGIEIANADGGDVHLLFSQTGGAGPGVPSWSPDGKKLVFFNTPGGPSNYTAQVWTMNADGSDQHRLYQSGCCVGDWAAPIWSPDGKMIAFSADSAGGTYVINADGSDLKKLTPNGGFATMSWQKLPGGRSIFVAPRAP
jgi:Tol biopolymer transport system component